MLAGGCDAVFFPVLWLRICPSGWSLSVMHGSRERQQIRRKYSTSNMSSLIKNRKKIIYTFIVAKPNFCQAQPQLQVKLSLKAELALFSLNPATSTRHSHPPPTPATHTRHPNLPSMPNLFPPTQFIFHHFLTKKAQTNLNTTSILWQMDFVKMDDDLCFWQMES
jgi:hypothetical protein